MIWFLHVAACAIMQSHISLLLKEQEGGGSRDSQPNKRFLGSFAKQVKGQRAKSVIRSVMQKCITVFHFSQVLALSKGPTLRYLSFPRLYSGAAEDMQLWYKLNLVQS
jgi:hypothetical protein